HASRSGCVLGPYRLPLSRSSNRSHLPADTCNDEVMRLRYKGLMLSIEPHPLLDLRAFITRFHKPLAEFPSSSTLLGSLSHDTQASLASEDQVRETIRRLLRNGGFKPTGRSKPASEYLLKAADEGRLGPINVAVDVCNAISMHSGLPISVVD